MDNKIQNISLEESWQQLQETDANVANKHVIVVTDSDRAARPLLVLGQPYMLTEGRFIRVVSGTAQMLANMRTFELSPCHVICLPPGTIFQYNNVSDDFRIEVFSYLPIPNSLTFQRVTMLKLNAEDDSRMGSYLRLMLDVLKCQGKSLRIVQLLQMAVFSELQQINVENTKQQSISATSRQEQVYNRFIDMVNDHGSHERSISFYADRLAISPNRLSTIIKDCSGRTVMQWLNEATTLRAKVMLRHSDKMVYEISDELNFPVTSSFVRFFKKNVGVTPLEYRRNN